MKKLKSFKQVKLGMVLKYVSGEIGHGIEIGQVISVKANNIRVRLLYNTLIEGDYTEDGYQEGCIPYLSILNDKEALAWLI